MRSPLSYLTLFAVALLAGCRSPETQVASTPGRPQQFANTSLAAPTITRNTIPQIENHTRAQAVDEQERRGPRTIDAQMETVAKGRPFAFHDAAFLSAVQQRWSALLEPSDSDQAGAVVITFLLHSNGRVTGLKVIENTVGERQARICQQAITDPAPYKRWPKQIREEAGKDHREVRMTFHYVADTPQ